MIAAIEDSAALARMLQWWGPERFKVFVAASLQSLHEEGLDADIALISFMQVCHRYDVDPDPIPEIFNLAPEPVPDEPVRRATQQSALSRLFAL